MLHALNVIGKTWHFWLIWQNYKDTYELTHQYQHLFFVMWSVKSVKSKIVVSLCLSNDLLYVLSDLKVWVFHSYCAAWQLETHMLSQYMSWNRLSNKLTFLGITLATGISEHYKALAQVLYNASKTWYLS